MDWTYKMNLAIAYIEENITKKLNTEEMAKLADCSVYHFQRIFAVMAGIPLSEYIRRRRMSLAVADLKEGDRIVDVALKYGYESPTAFNRAFQSVHGVAPSLVKHDGVSVKSYSPLTFQMVVKGVEAFDFKIEKKEAFRVVGASIEMTGDMADMEEPMEQFWEVLTESGTLDQIKGLADGEPSQLLEVMIPDENTEEWKYLLGVITSKEALGKLEEYTVGAYTWAMFRDEGQLTDGYRVLKEWLPTSGYEYDDGPDINLHIKDYEETEFWLPVRRKVNGDDRL